MAASLANVQTFWDNADAHSAFLARVAAAIVEAAIQIRQGSLPSPITEDWRYRQYWANAVLRGAPGALDKAREMLPALAVKANDAGLLDESGNLDATDAQIRNILSSSWIDIFTGYVPEV